MDAVAQTEQARVSDAAIQTDLTLIARVELLEEIVKNQEEEIGRLKKRLSSFSARSVSERQMRRRA